MKLRDIPSAVENIDWIIGNMASPDAEARREAAAGAQYALLGPLPMEKAHSLLSLLAERLELRLNGHAIPVEPDEFVRESSANAFEMAASRGHDVSAYLPVLRLSRDRDPHEWVREMSRDAIRYCEGNRMGLPRPETFTTRALPTAEAKAAHPSPVEKRTSA